MPDIGGLQLLPETRKKIEISLPGQNRLLIWGLIVLALVIGLYFGLMVYRQFLFSEALAVNTKLSDLEKSRDKQAETRLLNLKNQLAVVSPLLSSHFLWSDALTKVQSLVEPQVQFKNINADAIGQKIIISAFAANYTTIAKQIASFYSIDSVTDIILNNVQSRSTGVDFTMQLFFNDSQLLTKAKK